MSDLTPSSPRDHAFVRSDDPNFGVAFGGGCAEQVDGITCGWPERAHPGISSHPDCECPGGPLRKMIDPKGSCPLHGGES